MKHLKEIAKFVRNADYEATEGGILVHGGIIARGRYRHAVNGQDERCDTNLIPAEGIEYLLNAALGGDAVITAWYLALFSGAVTPVASWTAANFAANATEITSGTEGYSDATRPAWTPGAAAAGVIGNLTAKASFNIACTSSINVSGAALLSSNTKGGTAGTLASASRFAAVRQIYNGDVFDLGYEIELTDS